MKNKLIYVLTLVLYSATPSAAVLVFADFNDLSPGIHAAQAGGTGFDTPPWSGTGTIDVISGDLTAPASTNYSLTQSGNAHSIFGDYKSARQNWRSLLTALTGDTVWFSFLVQNKADSSRGGISFNQSSWRVGSPRVQTTGKTLYIDGATGSGDVFTAGETALVVGRITVDDAGDDTFDVWVNPDVSGGEAGLGVVTGTRTGAFFDATGITKISTPSYASGGGATLDMICLSDGPNGFADVTGKQLPAFAITGIDYDPDALPFPTVTLTWNNTGAAFYIAKTSQDLIDWSSDLDDSITPDMDERPDDGDYITVTFDLRDGVEGDMSYLYFRIEK
jgi:hypothetical protein